MTATITNHLGQTLTGDVRCWHGNRVVEIETPDGRREFGRIVPDPDPDPEPDRAERRLSTVDGAA
jgi:hypothetical protein